MVEEHSAALASRIDTEYGATPAPGATLATPPATDSAARSAAPATTSITAASSASITATSTVSNSGGGATAAPDDRTTSPSGSGGAPASAKDPGTTTDGDQPASASCDAERPVSKQSTPDGSSPGRDDSPKASCSATRSPDEGATAAPPAGPPTALGFVANPTTVARRLKQENERLQAEVTRLRRLVISASANAAAAHRGEEGAAAGGSSALETELQVAREALVALRADRKRLKAEKFELLNQMKQLYATLEDKEKELRDFIRNYEQRVRESDASLQQLSTEREERERERWSLLRHARDEAERSLSLAAQLNAKELQLRQAHEQLRDVRRQLHGCASDGEGGAGSVRGLPTTPGSMAPGDRGSCSADSGVVRDRAETASSVGGNLSDSTTDGAPTITIEGSNVDVDSISVVSSVAPSHMYQNSGALSRSVEQLSSPLGDGEPLPLVAASGRRTKNPAPSAQRPSGRGGTWGSISRVFARSRHRNKAAAAAAAAAAASAADGEDAAYRSWSPLTEEGYAEKLRLLREAASVPMERWRAPTVLAWLEIALGMPQYGPRCAENVKSGKVLLELSDLELECGLGITHPMHRKKLRLAIEEHRHPSLVRYPCIAQLGHTWVSSEWLPDLGLAQYSDSFAANMVDARMLEHLSKKELEKYLGVTRKFHQASIVHGIHLLRIMRYDRQALAVRRHQCETVDADPLVWSNQRFVRWARAIDLAEYADNLRDSGVHGGLVVLEPSFNGDTMATALGIPPGKNIVRRHLAAELEALVLPARSALGQLVRVKARSLATGSLGRPPPPPLPAASAPPPLPDTQPPSTPQQRPAVGLRGSLSRALGLARARSDKHSPTSSSESSSILSRASPLQQSGGESPVYATPCNYRYSFGGGGSTGRGATDHLGCECRVTPAKDFLDNILVAEGSGRRHHRRVRSIGDIDVIPVAPV